MENRISSDKDGARPYFLLGDKKRAVNTWWWRGDTNSTAEINAKKKQELSIGRQAIKRMPKKQQAAARKQLAAKVKQKYSAIKAKMPTSSGKTPGELVSIMRKIRTMRV